MDAMTSCEIVSRGIHFRNLPRLPVTMGRFGVNDTGGIDCKPPAGGKPSVSGADE